MAKILRHGKTPLWGTGLTQDGMIIDSLNITPELKDYEQTDENGAVCGYLVYDQTVNYDISGTIIANEEGNGYYFGCLRPSDIGNHTSFDFLFRSVNCSINTPTTNILKSFSISRSAGNAATFSASVTGYAFD